jgi:hypothetical protein
MQHGLARFLTNSRLTRPQKKFYSLLYEHSTDIQFPPLLRAGYDARAPVVVLALIIYGARAINSIVAFSLV